MKKQLYTAYLAITCIVCNLFIEQLPLHAQTSPLLFKHLTVKDGLSQSSVHAIYKDRMGFMWFGTDLGLNKYDGNRFTVYKYDATDSFSISSNYILAIHEDSYGSLWIGNGYSGLNRFDREKEQFIRYVNDPEKGSSISNNNIRAIFEDSQKNLWIGTAGGGLNLYDRQSDSFIPFSHDPGDSGGIGSNSISSIAEDKNGFLWLGSPDGIITKFNVKTKRGQSIRFKGLFHASLEGTTFGTIYIDSGNKIWYGSDIGLYCYDQAKRTIQHFEEGNTNKNLNSNAVSSIFEMEKDILLVSTDPGGLNVYDQRTGRFTYYVNSKYDPFTVSNNQLGAIYRSDDGIIWIGSYFGGVNILDQKSVKFQQYRNLVSSSEALNATNSVLAICEDKDKKIWIGTDGQGIGIFDPSSHETRHLSKENNANSISSNVVTAIYRDRNSDLWIGYYLEGFSRLDWKTKQFTHFKNNTKDPKGLSGNDVWDIFQDSEANYWIGTIGDGLNKFDFEAKTYVHYRNNSRDTTSLSNNDVYKIFQDKSGNIWIGTRDGLCRFNKSKNNFTRFISGKDLEKGIFGNWVLDIYQDQLGNLWIGTDQALNLYDPQSMTFTHFQEKEGLEGNTVIAISSDTRNNLWISTNNGLCQFNIHEKKFRNYSVEDGLQGNEFNNTSVLKSSDGRIYFGGKFGFNVFNPDSIVDNATVPPVYFTQLNVMNSPVGPRDNTKILSKHINFEHTITLTHKQSAFSLEFAALNYTNPLNNQYAYQLEGFDNDWIKIGNRHEVTYTNLNPGEYLLKVKGSNNDGIWNEKGASLKIIVLPPWWKTWWFKLISGMLLLGLLLLIYYLREVFYKNQQNKLQVLVKERTLQLEEASTNLETKQEEINSQNEELQVQKDEILKNNIELEKHRYQLELLVEERTRELIEARDRAEESDRLKSSFLANLSHEIRTPLNAILGFSQLLSDKNLNAEERKDYNRIIQGSSTTLLELISDILDISKIEAGQMRLERQEVCLETLIDEVIGIFQMFMKRQETESSKSVQLRVAVDPLLVKTWIVTDILRLKQVLSNLISNAIKFTDSGYIEIGCRKLSDNNMLEFYVKDTGRGIKEEYRQLVFDRFRKIEEDKTYLHRGTGLGLAISQQLVNLLGGSIYLTSEIGVGSVFYFTIPMIESDSGELCNEPVPHIAAVPDYGHCCILVAEDDISNFTYLEKLLNKIHFKVLHAVNGIEVLKILENNQAIELILMDIKMPVMDGIESLHALRKMGVDIPVIAQTAYALTDEVLKLKKEGFDDYISKPIMPEYLYSILDKYIKRVT
jgi:signal transduction histidine kinase/ligand-binding sensor domain-containing protein